MEIRFTENEVSSICAIFMAGIELDRYRIETNNEERNDKVMVGILKEAKPMLEQIVAKFVHDATDKKPQENPTPTAAQSEPIGKVYYTPPKEAEPDLNQKANELITSYIGRQVAVEKFNPTLRDVLNAMGFRGRDLAVLMDRLVPTYGREELTITQLKKLSEELVVDILVPVQNHWTSVKNLHLRAVDDKNAKKEEDEEEEGGFKL